MTAVRVRVGDIAEQIRGVTFPKAESINEPVTGYVPILRAGNIQEWGLDFEELVYVPESRVRDKQRVRKNDVLIAASSGSLDVVGKAARSLTDFEGGFGAFCKVLRPGPEVDASYFAHYFKTAAYRRKVSSLAEGANINNLKNEHLNDLLIPLPALAEQRRIAAILDRTDTVRGQRRQALVQLKDLSRSLFLDLFDDPVTNPRGWPRMRLGDVLSGIESGRSPVCESRRAQPGEWGVLKLGAVTYGVFNELENKAFLGDPSVMAGNEVRQGDLLMTRKNTRELVGAVALVDQVRPGLLLPDLIFRLVVSDGAVLKEYLQALLMNPRKRPEVRALASGSAGSMPNISKSRLSGLPVELPPIELQQEFARRARAVQALTGSHTNASNVELELVHAIEAQAFSGQL